MKYRDIFDIVFIAMGDNIFCVLFGGNQYHYFARFISSSHILESLSTSSRCKDLLLEYDNTLVVLNVF